MIEHADGTSTPLIDASVHIFFPSNKALRKTLREPFKSRGFPDYEMDWYGAPGGEYAPNTEGPDRQYPGSDPEFVANELFSKRGVDVAILHPMARGIMPDRHLGSALHAAHNEMMVSNWLESSRVRRPVPRHHPGQPRRHHRRAAGDREMACPSAGGSDRRPAAVPRGLRQTAVLAAVGSRGRRRPSGRCAHRGRLGHRVSADAEREHPHLRAVRQLHGAELPVPPDEPDRRGSVRALHRPEVRLGRWRRGLRDAVHVADGHVRPAAPRADAVGAADPQRLPARSRVFRRRAASTVPATPSSPASGSASPARKTW